MKFDKINYEIMAYNGKNYKQRVKYILDTYKTIKIGNEDRPDTLIVSRDFPKHGINISYRAWMNIKGLKPSDYSVVNGL